MKHSIILLLSILVISCGPSEDDALTWHNQIIDLQENSYKNIEDIRVQLEAQNYDEVEKKIGNAVKSNKDNIDRLNNLPNFIGGEKLKTASVTLMNSYQELLQQSIPSVIKAMKDDSISEMETTTIMNNFDALILKLETQTDIVQKEQKEFISKYNLTLEEASNE